MKLQFQLNEEDVLSYFRQRGTHRERSPVRLKMLTKYIRWVAGGGLLFILFGARIHGCMILVVAGLAYRFRHLLIEGSEEMSMEATAQSMDPLLKGVTTVTLDAFRIHHQTKVHDIRWELRDIERIAIYPDCLAIEHHLAGTLLIPTARLPLKETTEFLKILKNNVKPAVFKEEPKAP